MPQDMTLEIDVVVNGRINANGIPSVDALYAQTSSVPPSSGVVSTNGNIDLRHMDHNSDQYNVDTDITFNLSGKIVGSDEKELPFCFPSSAPQAVTISPPPGVPPGKLKPKSGITEKQVIINDENNDTKTYGYCLAIRVGTPPDVTTVKLDPSIVNR